MISRQYERAEIDAGILTKRVQILDSVLTQRESGATSSAPAVMATVWAGIEQLSGEELGWARQRVALATHGIVIRYRTGMNTDMKMKLGSRVFEIGSINNIL